MGDHGDIALVRSLSYLSEAQATIAHNLANVESPSFKRRTPRAVESEDSFGTLLDAKLKSVMFTETVDWSQGTLQPTGNSFDIALSKGDFFRVKGTNGEGYYTRNGQLAIDAAGRLVNSAGMPYLDEAGQELTLRSADGGAVGQLLVGPNGTIADAKDPTTILGRLGMFRVADADALQSVGRGVYRDTAGQAVTASPAATVTQHTLERSNVETTAELVQMLGIQRTFQATQKVLGSLHRMKDQYVAAMNR